MARKSNTSITVDSAHKHIKTAKYRAELSCEKIIGFHLQKGKTGGTYRFRYTGLDGKRKILNVGKYVDGRFDRINASEKAINYRANVEAGIDPKQAIELDRQSKKAEFIRNQSTTLGSYLEGEYKRFQHRKKNHGVHTLNIIRSNFNDFIDLPMTQLNSSILKKWQQDKENDGKSHATIQRAYSALKTMLNHAVSQDAIDSNPLAKHKLEVIIYEEKSKNLIDGEIKKRRMLTPDELKKLNKGASIFKEWCHERDQEGLQNGLWFYYFFRLGAYTGFRVGDLFSLKWTELNLNFKRIVKHPEKTIHHRDPAKVDLSLSEDMISLFKDWHKYTGYPADGYVFTSPVTGNKFDRQAHDKHWKKMLKFGEFETKLDFYSLRHHFISKLVNEGIPLFKVATFAGHKSTKMIEEHYGHLAPNASADPLSIVASDFCKATA